VKVLLDTDVIIDVALDRQPHVKYSSNIIDLAETFKVNAYLAWHSIANFYYLVSSASGDKKTRLFIKELLQFTVVAETTTSDAIFALDSHLKDFEDAMQLAAAKKCSAEFIITRNIKYFKSSIIPAVTPQQFLQSTLSKTFEK
jgi:predicted nucleic acid-binding protein